MEEDGRIFRSLDTRSISRSRVSFASVAVHSITTFIRVNEETLLAIQTNGPIAVESALINVKWGLAQAKIDVSKRETLLHSPGVGRDQLKRYWCSWWNRFPFSLFSLSRKEKEKLRLEIQNRYELRPILRNLISKRWRTWRIFPNFFADFKILFNLSLIFISKHRNNILSINLGYWI